MSMKNKYLQKMSESDLLTSDEEVVLSKILNDSGASPENKQRAREKLAESNFKLVAKIAYAYSHKTGADVEDLISEGYRGLMRAIDKYDYETYEKRFSTYAVPWITQGVKHYLYKSSFINIPSSIVDKAKKMKMLMEAGMNDESQIADVLKINEADIANMKMAIVSKVDLDETVVNKDGQVASFADVIEDKNVIMAHEVLSHQELSSHLMEAISELDEIQKDIVVKRWLDGEKTNLADLGKKYNMTGENVRLIEKKAFEILKNKMKDYA